LKKKYPPLCGRLPSVVLKRFDSDFTDLLFTATSRRR
jgi:hypothetical protein